jgi:type VI secretion system protein ImpC
MPGRLKFDFSLGQAHARQATQRRPESPLRILVMGDFSGRQGSGVERPGDLASRTTMAVDIDSFDGVVSRLAPRLRLPPSTAGGSGLAIEFRRLEDFYPDRLYRNLGLFQELREARTRLRNPATFAAAAAELRQGLAERPGLSGPTVAEGGDERKRAEDDAATFERLLGRKSADSPKEAVRSATQQADIQALIRSVVSPHIVPGAPPFQPQYVAAVDAALGDQMRGILHHPSYQALESAWRGIRWLVDNLDLGETLQLCLADVTKGELLADLEAAAERLDASGLYRLLIDRQSSGPDGEPWSLLVGHYTFGPDEEDVALLAYMGAIASLAGAPFLAGADARVVGCRSIAADPDPADWKLGDEAAQRWQALRKSSQASWIGLALPRVLLRLPYGSRTDPVEEFEFEELAGGWAHDNYLWGNPALACALLIGRSFLARGWDFEPGDELDVTDLPAHTLERDGEPVLQACAETYLTERAGQAILGRGVMPLLSFRNRNAVRVMRFQSLADPLRPLSGPWR